MRIFTSHPALSCFLLVVANLPLSAQQSAPTLDAQQKRHVITAESAQQRLTFHNLQSGQTYGLLVPGGEACIAQCMPDITVLTPNTAVISYNPNTHLLKFVASASTMEFQLDYPCTWDPADPPRHYVSIMRSGEKKNKFNLPIESPVLEVSGGSADQLVREVFIGGDCFDVMNVSYEGQGGQIGTFTNGLTNVGFANGVIMATGDISVAPGPNNSDGASGGYGIATPDGDLQNLTNGALFDMAAIEFDFTPTQSPLTFEYVFASEEYCEYVNSQFNDVFGFFISGPGLPGTVNLAVVPGTSDPITINTINHLVNSGFYAHNTPASGNNCGSIPPANGPAVQELEYDGFTRKMVAVANVVPCETYHIKLKIADVGDGVWDSAVFLKGGSFDGGGNASIQWLVNGIPDVDEVVEGCGTVQLLISRVGGSNPGLPMPVSFTITGTATNGVDFGPISTTYVIPGGQNSITIPVNIVNDLIPEGPETVIITLNNPCSCLKPQQILTILDYNLMAPVADTVAICGPGVATVGVTVEGGVEPYTYQWNTGGNDPTITPFVSAPTTYTVTVTDACGKTSTARARVNINQPPVAQLLGPNAQICAGQTTGLTVTFVGSGPFEITYNLNGVPQAPVTNIQSSPFTLFVSQPGTYTLTGSVDGAGCPGVGFGTVTVTPSTLDLNGIATNLACNGVPTGSINTIVTGGQSPFNYAWQGATPIGNVANPGNLPAGTYTVTVTDAFGCTDNQTFSLTAPTAIASSVLNIQGVNCFSYNSGNINFDVSGGTPNYTYLWSDSTTLQDPVNLTAGTYTVTVTDANGCTHTASAAVPGDFDAPTAVTSPPSTITCYVPTVTLDGTGSSNGGNFSYNWTAAPGNIVSGANTLNPVVNQAGEYILTVQNITNGCTSTASSTVDGNDAPPVASAGPNATITCALPNVTLDGSGSSMGGEFTYLWTASMGGNILAGHTTQNPIVSATGTYTILVTNTQNGCTSTDVVSVNNNLTPPTAVVAPPGLITCTVSEVTLNGAASSPAGISFQWVTSNGFIVSGQNSPSAVVNEAGQYTLIVTSPVNGCTNSQTVTVNQNFSAPIAVASSSNDITCNDLEATLSALASQMVPTDLFVWSTTNGNFVSGMNTLTPVVNAPGTYSIVITNPTSMCSSQASVLVLADNLPPAANAGPPGTLTCSTTTLSIGDPLAPTDPNLTYAWTASPGNISGGGNTPTPTVNQPGTYNLVVTNTANGCSNTANITIGQNITPPTVVVAPGGEINCVTPTIQLNGAGTSTGPTFSYQWTAASGSGIGAGDNTLTPTIIAPGTYTLVVTNAANGCTNSASATVTINADVPVATAAPMGILTCSATTVPLNSTGSTSGPTITYQWGTMNGQIVGPATGPQITAGAPGTYTLIVTNTANNCTATTALIVQQDITPPVADAGTGDTLSCTVASMALNGSGSSTGAQFGYTWSAISGGNFVSPTNIQNPQVNEAGVYRLVVTNVTNGCTAADQVEVFADDNDPVVALSQPELLNCYVTQTTINSTGSSSGPNFSYAWTGPGLQSSPNSPNATLNLPGNYTLVITNSDNGCTTEQTVPVAQDIQPPTADAGPDVLLNCYDPVMQIGGTNNSTGPDFTYNWIDPGGIISGWSTLSPTVAGGGTYVLIVTNTANGCTSSDPMSVTTDFEAPQANGGPTFQLSCTQTTYTLQAVAPVGPNFTYQWTTVGGSFLSPTNILNPTVDGAGEYYLLVTNTANGCTSAPSVQITQAADVPAAAANNAPNLTCAVTQVTLDGTGTDFGIGYNVQWTTANGNIVSGANTLNPVINAPGTYVITVINLVNQCQANSSVTVVQDIAPPAINAGPEQTLTCAVTSLNLLGTNTSPGQFIYNWYTPNGNIVSGANTLTPTINAVGYYELEAFSLQNGCSEIVSVEVVANTADPVSAIAAPDLLTCAVNQVTLDAAGSSTGNMQYAWTTAGGNIVNQSDPLAVVVNQPGSYTLAVTDLGNGCTSSASVSVLQDILPPTASAGTAGQITCAVTSLTLDGSGSSGPGNYFYQWTTANGNILVGANGLMPVVTAGGTYSLLVVDNDNGCSATAQVIVGTDTQPPVAAIASPGVIGCTQPSVLLNGSGSTGGANIQYEWTTPNGNILSGGSGNSATVNSAGQYTLNVLNTTNGCSSSQSVQVSDNTVLPQAEAGPPFTLTCSVTQATLQGSGSNGPIYAYAWSTQNGNILAGANSPNPVVNQPGTYALLVTNTTTGCTQTDNVQVFVETNVPTGFTFDLTRPGCRDNDGIISFQQVQGGFGPYSYSINGGASYTQTLDFAGIAPGNYNLFIQDANGCEFQQPLTVPQAPDPFISTPPVFNISLGEEQEIVAQLGPGYPLSLIESIVWTPLDGLSFRDQTIPGLLNPTAKPLQTTEYTVTIHSTDGCSASDRVLIRVDNRPHVYIPNAFSPWQEDGENDIFLIHASEAQIDRVDIFQIFDRWGDMVFSATNFKPNDPAYGWNGRHKGKLMTPAVFVYYAEIRLIDGRVLLYRGDVTLVR